VVWFFCAIHVITCDIDIDINRNINSDSGSKYLSINQNSTKIRLQKSSPARIAHPSQSGSKNHEYAYTHKETPAPS
jgi:hypothetical protein